MVALTERLPDQKAEAVRAAILEWYRRGHRDLPWRHTRDAYHVLVSEVMLQQTQVDRVLPKYLDWLERYPTLEALATAPRAEVIRAWSGLGYNLRAVRLHEIARQAVERYGGQLPETLEGLLSLKGIGRYTAAAVMCFARGAPEPVLDTNVRRVLGRIFAAEAPDAIDDDRVAWRVAEQALPDQGDVYDWNQALMDLGATVCLSRTPRCLLCPAQTWCTARQAWFAPEAAAMPGSPGVLAQAPLAQVAEERAPYDVGDADGASSRPVVRKAKAKTAPERFEGSRRWYRGRVVNALRGLPEGTAATLDELAERLGQAGVQVEEALLREIVAALARDGLAAVTGEGEGQRVALPV
ncbi:MAG: A/G-specific adenine glycosylase [uncultured Chloroflexi bacterium]|uniref:Adenine DNA glycosylase n=1 Tax=uncultured Chloroflexota bacterium TaxID=166587 RepID=A0A6J4KDZ6_9CHLR|nr:MAG: A/G-specific adenine glycosylase [uncultured Chloroflexota bacterium]